MLSYSHNELVDDHIMLDIAHEIVITSLNSCEPLVATCVVSMVIYLRYVRRVKFLSK
jgi:hypothetical protein